MRICLLGDLEDLASVYIGWLARKLGYEVIELAEAQLGVDWHYMVDDAGNGRLVLADRYVRWDEIAGIFVRLNPDPPLPAGVSLEEVQRNCFVQERREALHQLLEHVPCPVVNRPSAGRSNAAKPYQMAELGRAGFEVPSWIVSNDADAVRIFLDTHPQGAIYKASSGLRSRVRKVDGAFMSRLADRTTSAVIQEYIPGKDVRVHTVAGAAFACEVVGSAVDYRFEHERVRYQASAVPAALAERCCEHARNAGLVLAGLDFRVAEDERWYCLEMNPVPSFLPYEFSSGSPIGMAIIEAMVASRVANAGTISPPGSMAIPPAG